MIFSFSQPYEAGGPACHWRVQVGSLYSNAKYVRYATSNWNVLPGGLTFLVTGVPVGTHIVRLQYKFTSGYWRMSDANASEAYNSMIVLVL